MEEHSGAESPLICDLSSLDAVTRASHLALAAALLATAACERQELAHGYAFSFPAAQYENVARFIANERRCCPFIRFELDVPPHEGSLTLRMTGRAGVKAVIAAELGV